MHPFERYIRELNDTRYVGVKETSFYPALQALINDVGQTLSPKVRCILHPASQGAGIPDGGLYTSDQLRGVDGAMALAEGPIPARGVVEVKGTGEAIDQTIGSEQVRRYLGRYGQVLVTNLREFALVTQDSNQELVILERYRLAESEQAFWNAVRQPRSFADQHGERLVEYLRRVMLHGARLTTPRDVAWVLASYARDALIRVEAADLEALGLIRESLEETLGVNFEGEKGDHFFRSTLVQTLFYGIFSAWVIWSGKHPDNSRQAFNWREAVWELELPVLSALFYRVADPRQLEPLGLVEVLDWATTALNRVDREAFFAHFVEDSAVQYFYEPFVEAFDPELRKQLGIWYTPPEIVNYMVERVDTVLRQELGVADGLADLNVHVLDPATGTGSYLVAVLRRIARSMEEQGQDALFGARLKRAATERIFGFELLPAPFVVAHLQLGLLLRQFGAPLGRHERAGVYLTNSLTGWEPGEHDNVRIEFPELELERDAATKVKRERRILVVIGNPPYGGYAGVAIGEERELTDAYRVAKSTKQPQGQGLNDLYVRFFRMAERRIVDQTGEGIVCYISNYSWLDGLSFTAMRERYLEAFDRIWIDNLNGDKYKTGKLTPEGRPDPSIFSTEWNREGIQVGTAIALLTRRKDHRPSTEVRFRDLWGQRKRQELAESTAQDGEVHYHTIVPEPKLGLPFSSLAVESNYFDWPAMPNLFPISYPGVQTGRDSVLIDIDPGRLRARMEQYFDRQLSDEDIRRTMPSVMESRRRFDAPAIRKQLVRRGFLPDKIVPYCYQPFDVRWLYWEPETKLLDEKRSELFSTLARGDTFLISRPKAERQREGVPFYTTSHLPDRHLIRPASSCFVKLNPLLDQGNLTHGARSYLDSLGAGTIDVLWQHVLATGYSPAYLRENASGISQDWPRIPLPNTRDLLQALAELGKQIAALLDPEQHVRGVTIGSLRPELREIGVMAKVGGGNLREDTGELAVTAGWGHLGQRDVTMPGQGRAIKRAYAEHERAAIYAGGEALALSCDQVFTLLGEETYDIYLNDVAYWRNVPAEVWSYTIGGYQVIKKWLSYREQKVLGRDLKLEEVELVSGIIRRITAILLLQPSLDASYQSVKASTFSWPGTSASS